MTGRDPDHEAFLETLPGSGMFITSGMGVQGRVERFAALGRGVHRRTDGTTGRLGVGIVLVGLGLGLVVLAFVL